MNYKEIIYSKYLSNHFNRFTTDSSLENIEKYFASWRYYYYNYLPKDKASKILEIGCGSGGFIYWLNKMGYNNTIGIDISDEQVGMAKKMEINNIIKEDIVHFLYECKGKYDLIIARDVLEHFTKSEVYNILNLIYEALSEEGGLLVQVPNGQGLFFSRIYYGDFTHECAFTEASLDQIFLNTGFLKTKYSGTGPVPKGAVSFVRFILWKFVVVYQKFWQLVETGTSNGIYSQTIIALAKKCK